MTAVPTPVRAADEADIVVLLHPSIKHWEAQLAASVGKSATWLIEGEGDRSPRPARMRVAIGGSIKELKDWRYVFQLKAPRQGTSGIARSPALFVSYALLFRESVDAKPVELATGQVESGGRTAAAAEEGFLQSGLSRIEHDAAQALGTRVLVGKPKPRNIGIGRAEAWCPSIVVRDGGDAIAEVRLHNQLPVAVRLTLEARLDPWVTTTNQRYVMLPGRDRFVELAAGEKKTLRLPLADYDVDVVPRWFKLSTLIISDPKAAAR